MIFSSGANILESEKERNLYTKFFAGYFFNELIDGYEDRLLLISKYLTEKLNTKVSLKRPSISFDNHAYLLNSDSDQGEFADILLYDTISKTMIAIEAKYLTDWSFKKDIEKNLERIKAIQEMYEDQLDLHFCLLVSKTKWEAVKKAKDRKGSNYTRLEESKHVVGKLFWEDLTDFCDSVVVKEYMKYRLSLVNAPVSQRYANIQN